MVGKTALLLLGMMGLAVSGATIAFAETCSQRAANCVAKGGSKVGCYSRVAQCKRTCVYVGPSGQEWPATNCSKAKKATMFDFSFF
jgi:hypothetical protein